MLLRGNLPDQKGEHRLILDLKQKDVGIRGEGSGTRQETRNSMCTGFVRGGSMVELWKWKGSVH